MEKTRELPALFVLENFLPRGFVLRRTFTTEEQKAVVRHLLAKGRTMSDVNNSEKFRGTFAMFPYKASEKVIIREDKIQSNKMDFDGLGIEFTIRSCTKVQTGSNLILMLHGERKVRLLHTAHWGAQFSIVGVDEAEESGADLHEAEKLRREIEALANKVVDCGLIEKEQIAKCVNQTDVNFFADSLIYIVTSFFGGDLTGEESRALYKGSDIVRRLKKIRDIFLKKDNEILTRKKVAQELETLEKTDEKSHRRALLEQKKRIEKELKETDPLYVPDSEFDHEFDERIFQANMPPEIERIARKQLRRLKDTNHHEEAAKIRTYLEWLCDVPWSKRSDDVFEPAHARRILDEDHYDLEKIKKRIVEYVATRKLNRNKRGPILCLVGPPGVGKTSIGRSLARALGREFVRISVGGVRDEAEIRGHRRTYIGALPGRIIQGMKKAGTINPVFLIDEIDKLSHDSKDNPSAALLEVLDLEHNHEFSDHYLEAPYDLSQVIFVCTANSTEPIAPPLQDRLEILRLPGYTQQEKFQIAKRFLVPKQLSEHGMDNHIDITDGALGMVINEYTKEAGVRNLEREIANIIRNRAVLAAEKKNFEPQVKEGDILEIIGPPKFARLERVEFFAPGNIAYMAWTEYGGRIFILEAMRRGAADGDPRLICTGKLGKVMQESAQVAFACAYNHLKREGTDLAFMENDCFHLHCPEGAVPKEGASAGLPFALNIISLLTGKIVRSDAVVAGEIAIRSNGLILPIDGIKERLLAAHRASYEIAIIPEKNTPDLKDVPEEIKASMDIRLVRTLSEAVKIVFV